MAADPTLAAEAKNQMGIVHDAMSKDTLIKHYIAHVKKGNAKAFMKRLPPHMRHVIHAFLIGQHVQRNVHPPTPDGSYGLGSSNQTV